jgi:hypothetical protein
MNYRRAAGTNDIAENSTVSLPNAKTIQLTELGQIRNHEQVMDSALLCAMRQHILAGCLVEHPSGTH